MVHLCFCSRKVIWQIHFQRASRVRPKRGTQEISSRVKGGCQRTRVLSPAKGINNFGDTSSSRQATKTHAAPEKMAHQNGGGRNGAAEQSRSGLLVAQQVLNDKLSNDGEAVYREFERLRRTRLPGSFHVAQQPANERRNRYSNVLPFDENRVRLSSPQHDYINASMLASPASEAPAWRYIATQGPKDSTVGDFWQMVYERNCAIVIMLTRLVESGTLKKCAEYFPEELDHPVMYKGSWTVTCVSARDVDSDVRHRDLIVTPPSPTAGPPRKVCHFHYHAWPDHGVPSTTQPLRDLVQAVRGLHTSDAGPPVVHCSAGIGRTGTFCAVDIALARLRSADYGTAVTAVELKPVVAELRRQRAGMVQTAEQYLFCYRAVKDEVDKAIGTD
ncbi:Tyrosine-protein phosphatase non-receptor type 1 [Coccomyxa sp. Obi]|nr:Tyrosine-protein phosphatase non-receptor type 1 [Coccomyxa sp. Obi]